MTAEEYVREMTKRLKKSGAIVKESTAPKEGEPKRTSFHLYNRPGVEEVMPPSDEEDSGEITIKPDAFMKIFMNVMQDKGLMMVPSNRMRDPESARELTEELFPIDPHVNRADLKPEVMKSVAAKLMELSQDDRTTLAAILLGYDVEGLGEA
jgi:hypothetical protein